MITFNHFNFNVLDLEKSLAFYKEALNLEPVRRRTLDGSLLVYLGDGVTDFTLELTWLRDRKEAYDLGECEFHLAFHVDDFDGTHKHHEEMGCICYENPGMGIYLSRTRTATGWKSCLPISREYSWKGGCFFERTEYTAHGDVADFYVCNWWWCLSSTSWLTDDIQKGREAGWKALITVLRHPYRSMFFWNNRCLSLWLIMALIAASLRFVSGPGAMVAQLAYFGVSVMHIPDIR